MGFLDEGRTLTWDESLEKLDYVREHGVLQLIHIYNTVKGRRADELLWGEEVEYMMVRRNETTGLYQLRLNGHELAEELNQQLAEERSSVLKSRSESFNDTPPVLRSLAAREPPRFLPEYGRFMIEATPGEPYVGNAPSSLALVEPDMARRRQLINQIAAQHGSSVATITSFPGMGVGAFTWPEGEPMGPVARSHFIPDIAIHPHPRFPTLTENIRLRRRSKVAINVPVFRDVHTVDPLHFDADPDEQGNNPALDNHIYMDAMCFGMGCCCLQITFQCCSINQARFFYDQLAVLCPVMTTLSAAAPIYRGYLSDQDIRWNVISGSVDCRQPEERGILPLDPVKSPRSRHPYISKSRYDTISWYISADARNLPEYNDLDVVLDQKTFDVLKAQTDMDDLLATHFAHLFIRDPMVIYSHKVEMDDESHADHFENIQSTNWQTVRFKPPPPGSTIGWRVEFRPLEVQFTDFENAAFSVFVVLLTRVIATFDLNLYIPLSCVDKNMERAHGRDAVLNQKFIFRKHVLAAHQHKGNETVELTPGEIFNGSKSNDFPGLVPLVHMYLDTLANLDADTRTVLNRYLTFIAGRADGTYKTNAAWSRDFVQQHPDYKQDSVVSPAIASDLVQAALDIASGARVEPSLFPE